MKYYCLELNINFNNDFLAYFLNSIGLTIFKRQKEIEYSLF